MRSYLVPKEGMKLRDPVLKDYLPATGRLVEMSPYWTRRLQDKDVVEGKAPPPPPKKAPPVKPAQAPIAKADDEPPPPPPAEDVAKP